MPSNYVKIHVITSMYSMQKNSCVLRFNVSASLAICDLRITVNFALGVYICAKRMVTEEKCEYEKKLMTTGCEETTKLNRNNKREKKFETFDAIELLLLLVFFDYYSADRLSEKKKKN